MEDSIYVVMVTVPTQELAVKIAGTVVEEFLAACASIVPQVRSFYHWQGNVCDESELLLILKTTVAKWDSLRQRIVELHTYEVPEIIAIPLRDGHSPYLQWIRESTLTAGLPAADTRRQRDPNRGIPK
jgi:periplasmic divalent cation tolerance protein